MNEIEKYISEQPTEIQPILKNVKECIEAVLPRYEIKMSYQMPTYKDRKNVIHFAAQKKHLGIYPGPKAIVAFEEELTGYKTSKGAIQFPYDKKIPYELIAKIALYSFNNQ